MKAWDQTAGVQSAETKLAEQIELLRAWDLRWAVDSVPTSLAVFWGDDIQRRWPAKRGRRACPPRTTSARKPRPANLLQSLAAASDTAPADFGNWKTPWGDINRFQRLTGDIVQPFSDAGPSIPVGFTVRAVGFAGFLRSARLSGDEEVVRHQRQQLRRRSRVRRPRARHGRDRGRRKRRSEVAPLQRSGEAVQHGRPAGRLLLPLAAQGAHRADAILGETGTDTNFLILLSVPVSPL